MGYLQKILAEGETVVFSTRRHWLALLPTILLDVGLAIVIIALTVAGNIFLVPGWSSLILILLIIPVVHFVVRFISWRGEQCIITNRRAIDIKGIFNKYVADSSLEKVNDVILQQSFLGRLLDYGDLRIITGSDIGAETYRRIAHPVRFKIALMNQKSRVALRGEDVPTLLARLDELRKAGTITDEEFEREKKELLARL